MTVTWRDAVTTVAAAAVVVMERAYFHSWSWLTLPSLRWTMVAFAVLGAIVFLLNAVSGRVITWVEYALGVVGAALVAAGLWTNNSDYLVLTMLAIIAVWAVSLGSHAVSWFTHPAHKTN